MVTKEIIIKSPKGLNDSVLAKFQRCAFQYKSEIVWEACGHRSIGKSLGALMSLEAGQGDVLKMTAEGPDELELIDALVALNESM